MADFIKYGSFTTSVSTGTVTEIDEDDLGFEPQAIILISPRSVSAGTASTNYGISIGLISQDGSQGHAIFGDGGAGRRVQDADGFVIANGSGALVQGVCTITPGTGLEVNYSAVDASNSYTVHWVAIGGDSVNAAVDISNSFGWTSGSFQPQLAISTTTDQGSDASNIRTFFCVGASNETTHINAASEYNDDNGDRSHGYDNNLPGRLVAGAYGSSDRVPDFVAGGVNTWDSFGTGAANCSILSINGLERGFNVVEFQADSSGTTNATQELPDLGFTPGLMILISATRTAKGDPGLGDARASFAIGVATPTNEFFTLTTLDAGSDETIWNTTGCLALGIDANSLAKRGTITAWDSTPQITWEVNDASAYWIGVIAFEEDTGNPNIDGSFISSTAQVYAGVVEGEIDVSLIAATSQAFEPDIEGTITGNFIASTAAIYAGAFEGEIDVLLIGSTSQVFAPDVEGQIVGNYIASSSTIYAPDVEGTITVALIASTAQVFAGDIPGADQILGELIGSTSTAYEPDVEGTVTAALLASTAQVFAGEIEGEISPAIIASTAQAFAGVVEGTIAASFIAATSLALEPDIEGTITGQVIASTAQVFAGSVEQPLAFGFIASTSAVFAGVLEGTINVNLIASTAQVFAGSLVGPNIATPTAVAGYQVLGTPYYIRTDRGLFYPSLRDLS